MKLPVISGRKMVKVLHRKGWTAIRQTGSHVIMQKDDVPDELSIPQHNELKPGIVRRCIEIAGLTENDFKSLLPPTEILADGDLMYQIRKSKRKDGKSRDFEEVADVLGI